MVDDLIAVLVIAFFYTSQISYAALGVAGLCLLVLLLFNFKKVNNLIPYLLVGFAMWWAVLESGVHATVAGVILAFTIPLHRGWDIKTLKEYAQEGFELFELATDEDKPVTEERALRHLNQAHLRMESPLKRLERKLHTPVYFIIMPLFAFANAGILLNPEIVGQAFISTLAWGIILGLFVGKQIGVFGATWVLVKFFSPDISPQRETWKVIYGIAVLCGIGFTMSIFVSNLSFADPALLEFSKIGVLAGSLVSGLAGYFLLSSKTQYEAESQKSLNVPE